MQIIENTCKTFAVYGSALNQPLAEVSFFSQIEKDNLWESSYCFLIITQLLSV